MVYARRIRNSGEPSCWIAMGMMPKERFRIAGMMGAMVVTTTFRMRQAYCMAPDVGNRRFCVSGKQVIVYIIADGRRDMQTLLTRRMLGV